MDAPRLISPPFQQPIARADRKVRELVRPRHDFFMRLRSGSARSSHGRTGSRRMVPSGSKTSGASERASTNGIRKKNCRAVLPRRCGRTRGKERETLRRERQVHAVFARSDEEISDYHLAGSAIQTYPEADAMKLRSLCALALSCFMLPVFGGSIAFSTFLGGTASDGASAVATDLGGNTIVVGDTYSTNFMGLSRAQLSLPDGFVVKLDANGAVVFKKLIGGNGYDIVKGVATDRGGNIYVTGYTGSLDFPGKNAFRATAIANGDAFLVKMTSSGDVIYATYFGGSGIDEAISVAADSFGNAYVTGFSNSTNLPLVHQAQGFPLGGNTPSFLFKISPDGSALVYSTYLGGSGQDLAYGVKVDDLGNAYVAGIVTSSNFPTTANAFQRNRKGPLDGFLTKFDPNGAVAFSTLIGGQAEDGLTALDVGAGGIYVAGVAASHDFPTRNAMLATKGGSPVAGVAAKFTTGGDLVYSTYLGNGGAALTQAPGIGVNASGEAAILLTVSANTLPTTNAVQPVFAGVTDAYVVQLNASGSARDFATYFGGDGSDVPTGLAVDAAGRLTFCGQTLSRDLPVAHAAQPQTHLGTPEGFVTRLQLAEPKRRAARH